MGIDNEMVTVKSVKETIELIKLILEQNRIILVTNKMLLEHLAAPPIIYKSKTK